MDILDELPSEKGNLSPALLNDLILKRLFHFLELDDLKSCRRVCKSWLTKAETPFRKRTRLSFDFFYLYKLSETDSIIALRSCPAKSLYDIFESSTRSVTLDSLGLTGIIPWTTEELSDFFTDYGQIADLKLKSVLLRDRHRQNVPFSDCTEFLSENNFQNLSKLSIDCQYSHSPCRGTEIVISLPLIQNVKELVLKNCSLFIHNGFQICPRKLTFYGVVCFIGEKSSKPAEVLMNNFIDFTSLKYFEVTSNKLSTDSDQNLCIDMQSDIEIVLDFVLLESVKIVNWEKANWRIGKLKTNQDFTKGNNQMTINEIILDSAPRIGLIQFLPTSLKRLTIDYTCKRIREELNGDFHIPLSFPNLKYLSISAAHYPILPNFLKCPKLTALELHHDPLDRNYPRVEMDMINTNIKNLGLHSDSYIFYEPDVLNLDVLVFKNYEAHLRILKQMAECFLPKAIVIENPKFCIFDHYTNVEKNDKLLQLVLIENSQQHIWIGPFNWENNEFETSKLHLHVDRKAEYYYFNGGTGVAIPPFQFEKLSKL